jgi:putative sigma-54 modulation protein
VNGTRIKGVEETGDMYSAIDQVVDKIEKQVKRHLSKIRDRRSENQRGEGVPLSEVAEEVEAMHEPLIEVEEMVAKPMAPEEAAMQLNLSRRDFMVFRNDKTQKINVIYRKGDGNLGLIQPTG